MPTLNRSYVEYIPRDDPLYVIPCQQGSVYNLSIAITPNRQGILGWYDPDANEMRCAVVPDFDDCFTDNVVAPGDVRTVWASPAIPRRIHTGSIWAWDGFLYAFVSMSRRTTPASPQGRTHLFVADDIENPTSWSFLSEVQNLANPNYGPFTVREGGVPTVLDTGRWVLPFHSWVTFGLTATEDGIGIYTSDDSGVTWVPRVRSRLPAGQGGSAGPQSTTIALEPSSGELWFGSRIGPGDQWRPYSSSDSGGSWLTNVQSSGNRIPHYYIDDGTTMYAGLVASGAMNLFAIPPGANPIDPDTWTDLQMRGIVSDGITFEQGFQIIPVSWPTPTTLVGVAFAAKDRLVFSPVCEPVHPDPLHIPYKDRLETLAADFTTPAIAQAQEEQYDNFKVIERWAHGWMTLTESPLRCELFIPYKDHSRQPPGISAAQSFDNWKAIERWAYSISDGDCGCNCTSASEPPPRCRLFVPWKDHLLNVELTDPEQLATAAAQEFDNFKALERWAFLFSSGTCGCTV